VVLAIDPCLLPTFWVPGEATNAEELQKLVPYPPPQLCVRPLALPKLLFGDGEGFHAAFRASR
jgi:hypothetical protein